MAGNQIPGPVNAANAAAGVPDGTLPVQPSAAPGPVGATVPAVAAPAAAPGDAAAPTAGASPAPGATAAATETTDPDIEALDLTETARKAAYALKKAHPSVTFTSGRRDKAAQASAMASNVVENRKWIEETYAKSTAREKCQKWVDDNPEKKTKDEIAEGLEGVLDGLTDGQLGALSKHLGGAAFDVQPVDEDADAIKKTIQGLSGLDKFLDKEGGLVRWHAQF